MKRNCLIKTTRRHAERVLIIHHPENGEVKVSLILIAFFHPLNAAAVAIF